MVGDGVGHCVLILFDTSRAQQLRRLLTRHCALCGKAHGQSVRRASASLYS